MDSSRGILLEGNFCSWTGRGGNSNFLSIVTITNGLMELSVVVVHFFIGVRCNRAER